MAGGAGRTIQLTVIATLTEFLGYDTPPKDTKVRVWEGDQSRLVDPPLPRFRVRQMQTQAQVQDGQTLVLAGFSVNDTPFSREKVPGLGDLPSVGRRFRSDSKPSARKVLYVFVTATLIDAAGNPMHPADRRAPDPAPSRE